ncbi:MAG: phosphoglucosamine mutase [Candidatus Hadarchaeota archaeon]
MEKLFGTSGVRGLVGKEITPEFTMRLGLALASQIGNSGRVVVGRDPRTSGEMLESSVISGLLSGGCDVVRLGIVPTPAVSFAVRSLKANAGVMITASHNPPEYNGMKLWDSKGMAYTPKLEKKIEIIYSQESWGRVEWREIGGAGADDIIPSYIDAIAGAVKLSKEFKVVVDCGNGAASAVTPVLLRRMGCEVISINCNPDGHFPGRGLEPNEFNLKELAGMVKSVGADIGLAHDGDADRVAAVDEKGRFVKEDKLLALISAFQLRRKGQTVVTTVDASSVLDKAVKAEGGKVVRTRVGDVSVAEAVKKRRAVFGGEPSGAWIFPEFQFAPDGPFGAAKILQMLATTGKKLSELSDGLPDYPTVREKVACPNERKASVIKKLAPRLRKLPGAFKASTVDGVRVEFRDGWVLVRPSGTEPYIRVTAEGKTVRRARKIAGKAVKILKSLE